MSTEHNPDNLTPEHNQDGWRRILVGEILQAGDQWESEQGWEDIEPSFFGDRVVIDGFRRRITPDAGKAEAQTLILEETPELQSAEALREYKERTKDAHIGKYGAPAQQPAEAMPETADSELSRLREENERLKERLRAYGYSLATPAPASALLDVLDQWSEPREPKPVTSVAPPQPNGCTCYGTPPTVPVFRDKDDHLPGCPARNRMVDVEAQRWGHEVERLERERDHWRGLHVSTLKSLTTALEECDKLIAQLSTERAAREQEFANYKDALDKAALESLTSLTTRLAESESREHAIYAEVVKVLDMLKGNDPTRAPSMWMAEEMLDAVLKAPTSKTVADLRLKLETAERERDAVVKVLDYASEQKWQISWNPYHSAFIVQRYDQVVGNIGRGRTILNAINAARAAIDAAIATTQETK